MRPALTRLPAHRGDMARMELRCPLRATRESTKWREERRVPECLRTTQRARRHGYRTRGVHAAAAEPADRRRSCAPAPPSQLPPGSRGPRARTGAAAHAGERVRTHARGGDAEVRLPRVDATSPTTTRMARNTTTKLRSRCRHATPAGVHHQISSAENATRWLERQRRLRVGDVAARRSSPDRMPRKRPH